MIMSSRSRRHLLRRVLGVVFPILCGIGAYVLVMLIAPPNDALQAPLLAQEGRIDSRYEYYIGPGPLPPPLPAACWKYKPPLDDVIVGEAAEIGLDVWVCAGAELPSDITVEAASGSNNVALSGPAEIERSQTSQSWVWRRPSILPVSTECLSQCAVPTWKTRRSIRSSVLTPRRAFGAASWTHYQAVVRR